MKKISQKLMDTIASYMDDDIREQVHYELAPCTPEEFLIGYLDLYPEFEVVLWSEFSIRFVPNWDDEDQNMNNAFFRAVDFATEVLNREIARMQSSERAEREVRTALDNSDGSIVILDRFVPWQGV